MIDIEDMARRRLGEGLMAETEARMARNHPLDLEIAILRALVKRNKPRVRPPVTYKLTK